MNSTNEIFDIDTFRVSDYTIYTEVGDSHKETVLIHGYTGAIDIVSNKIATLLKKNNISAINADTFDKLRKRGYITEKTCKEEKEFIAKFSLQFGNIPQNMHFMFVVSYDCNFKCPYCFQHTNHTKSTAPNTISKELVDRAFMAMLEMEPDINNHSKRITLYGGEPLLLNNKEIVEYIVKKGASKGYSFNASTNGYDLNHFSDLLGENLINDLQITIDGDKEVHDKRRVHKSDNNTFDKIFENIEMCLKKEITVRLRIHVDKINLETIDLLMQYINSKEYRDNKFFKPYFALVKDYGCSGEKFDYIKGIEFWKVYEEIVRKYNTLKTTFTLSQFTNFFNRAIDFNKPLNLSPIYCPAHANQRVFDPFGDIYTCWEVVGNTEQAIGSYLSSPIKFSPSYDYWLKRNVSNMERCRKCKFALLCGGGCAGHLVSANKNIYNSNCEDFKKILHFSVKNRLTKIKVAK